MREVAEWTRASPPIRTWCNGSTRASKTLRPGFESLRSCDPDDPESSGTVGTGQRHFKRSPESPSFNGRTQDSQSCNRSSILRGDTSRNGSCFLWNPNMWMKTHSRPRSRRIMGGLPSARCPAYFWSILVKRTSTHFVGRHPNCGLQ